MFDLVYRYSPRLCLSILFLQGQKINIAFSSEPIDPPAPVIKTRFLFKVFSIEFMSSFTSSLPKRSEYETSLTAA